MWCKILERVALSVTISRDFVTADLTVLTTTTAYTYIILGEHRTLVNTYLRELSENTEIYQDEYEDPEDKYHQEIEANFV